MQKKIIALLLLFVAMLLNQTIQSMLPHTTLALQETRSTTNSFCIHAYVDGKIAGSISRKENQITHLDVNPTFRNKLIGSTLVIKCLDHIKKDHTHAYWLAFNSVSFFERFGARSRIPVPFDTNSAYMEFVFAKDGNPEENLLRHVFRKAF